MSAASVPAVEGVLLVDKPKGITSHDAVAKTRRALGTKKVGHAGTLDPMATGLLVMGIGRATRLLRFFGDMSKTYEGTMKLGQQTDTLDAEGKIVATGEVGSDVTDDRIREEFSRLEGPSMQVPPAFSALSVGGRRLHDAARKGEPIQAEARPIDVYSFELLARRGDEADFRVVCGGGTYVRVLAADVGAALGCGAHLTALRRVAIGPFSVANAGAPDDPRPLLPIEAAVSHLPKLELSPDEAFAASNGVVLGPAGIEGPYGVYFEKRLIGVYEDAGSKAKPMVILASSGFGYPA